MRNFFDSFNRIFFLLCVFAFFINIGLFVGARLIMNADAAFELEILSLINMMLLSFVLLRDSNLKME